MISERKSRSATLSFIRPSLWKSRWVRSNNEFFIPTALAVFLLLYSYLLSVGPSLLGDPDTLWHIRTGQWILDHAQFPTVDFYSYTEAGRPWISTEWLSEILYAVAFDFGGWRAVTILAGTACAATIGIVCFYLLRHLRFSVAIGWTVLTWAAISPHFLARPHVFSYVLLAIWTIKLLDAYDDDKFDLPSLFSLVPLMILWANLHGSFTLGLVLLYIFAGFCLYHHVVQQNYTKCWRLLAVTTVVSVSALITPYGISPAYMTTTLLNMSFTYTRIGEWHPPNFQQFRTLLIYLVAILSAIAGLGIRVRGPRLIAFALITVMGLSYFRGLMMFFVLLPIIFARPAAGCVWYLAPQLSVTSEDDRASDTVLRFLQKRVFGILAGCMALAVSITVWTWWRKDIVPSLSIAPKAAIEFVQRTNITGNVFNWYNFGGYLIFSGIPTFVDGRADLFGDAFLQKYQNAVDLVDINDAFELLDEYKVSWVVLGPKAPLVKALVRSTLWDEVYSDEYSVVLVRHH